MIKKKDLIQIRPGDLMNDSALIYSTWLRSIRHSYHWFELIDQDLFYRNYSVVIRKILENPNTQIQVACLKDDRDVALGYSVAEGSTLHFLFVKPIWRRIGLALDLAPKPFKKTTSLTPLGEDVLRNKFPNVIFDPFYTEGETHV